MENLEKVISLAKKMKELADRGDPGEKENAAEFLEQLLIKHNLTIEDVVGEKTTERSFKYEYNNTVHRKFVMQVIASVIGVNRQFTYTLYSKASYRIDWVVDITDAEFIEISEKLEFFWPIYKKEHELFYGAFVQKNKLYTKDGKKKDEPLTPEEEEKIQKIMIISEGLDEHTLTKKLNN